MYNNRKHSRNSQKNGGENCRGLDMPQAEGRCLPRGATTDFGPMPFVTDISRATEENMAYRTALWTGSHLQLTLMSIPVGGEIGLEVHPDTDQFLRLEEGSGLALMGSSERDLSIRRHVSADSAVFVPAGTWHNVVNTGIAPIKIYTIYAPPHHPWGTVEQTKEDSDAAETQGF